MRRWLKEGDIVSCDGRRIRVIAASDTTITVSRNFWVCAWWWIKDLFR